MARGKYVSWLGMKFIYGRDGEHESLYLARLPLSPRFKKGRLFLHIFLRPDQDPDHHDHPWEFWTFPLKGYYESVMDFNGWASMKYVHPWRWSHRQANHAHRVRWWPGWLPLVTLVWHGPKIKRWGFYVTPRSPLYYLGSEMYTRGECRLIHWRDYLYGLKKWETASTAPIPLSRFKEPRT